MFKVVKVYHEGDVSFLIELKMELFCDEKQVVKYVEMVLLLPGIS